MRITFIGAAHEVTGSCTFMEVNDKNFLTDCGMEQGENVYENAPLPVSAEKIDFVLLTHAHMDHAGNLPLLYKNGFRGKVFATKATCSLCDIMLKDSANIQMSDAAYHNRKAQRAGRNEEEPLYTLADAEGVLSLMFGCNYHEKIKVCEGVTIRFTDIGHLLGSACIEIWLKEGDIEKKIVFSGDVGNRGQTLIRDPQPVDETDYLVIESTYGDRLHERRETKIDALAELLQKTLDRGGNVVIPSFAVGRTQELLYFIREIKENKLVKGHGVFPVYVDSPLANEATSIFSQCDPAYLDDETRNLLSAGINPLSFPGLRSCISAEDSKSLNDDIVPKVIISASGMCDAGRIRHHLKYNLWRPESLILFVGYQAHGTLGRLILDGAKSVKLFGDDIAIKAEICVLPGISGHADKAGLLDWVSKFSKAPELIFVNHGESSSCDAFAATLSQTFGCKTSAPFSGTSYDLATGAAIIQTEGVLFDPDKIEKQAHKQRRGNDAHMRLLIALDRLQTIAKNSAGLPERNLRKFTDQVYALAEKWKRK